MGQRSMMVRWSVLTAVLSLGTATSAQADETEVALRVAADQILMISPKMDTGAPPLLQIEGGRRQLWSATVGGGAFAPEQVMERLFGKGRAEVSKGQGGLDVLWHTGSRTWQVGRVAKSGEGLRLEPGKEALEHRNALVGQAVLATLEEMRSDHSVDTRELWQPPEWISPPEKIDTIRQGKDNLLHRLAAKAKGDPLLAGLAPMPETHFLMPEGVDHHERERLRRAWRDWAFLVRNAFKDERIAAAQKSGVVRPFRLMWRDAKGAHSIGIRTDTVEGKPVRSIWYRTAPHRAIKGR